MSPPMNDTVPDTLVPWARSTVYWAGGVLFLAGFGMSAWALTVLMRMFGIPDVPSYALFLAADAGAIVGVVMWVGGTGENEAYGRRLARLLFGLSIAGNGLERLFAFATPAGAESPTDAAATLAQFTGLVRRLGGGDLDSLTLYFGLAVSICLGVVFPVLAYRMGHAIILARKSNYAATRKRKSGALTLALASLVSRVAAVDVPNAVGERPVDTASRPPAKKLANTSEKSTEPPATPDPVVQMPYIHDDRYAITWAWEVGSPEWQDRFDRLPGSTKREKCEAWLEREWAAGRNPSLSGVADRVVDGKRVAQQAKAALAKRDVYPPDVVDEPAGLADPAEIGAADDEPAHEQSEEMELAHAS